MIFEIGLNDSIYHHTCARLYGSIVQDGGKLLIQSIGVIIFDLLCYVTDSRFRSMASFMYKKSALKSRNCC